MFDPNSASDVETYENVSSEMFAKDIFPKGQPAVLKGFVNSWPAVQAAKRSDQDLIGYLKERDRKDNVPVMQGPPSIDGRFFYNDDLTDFNFNKVNIQLSKALSLIEDQTGSTVYIQSVPAPELLQGFERENRLEIIDGSVVPRLWIGNRLTVQTHFDLQDNMACVVAGRRRFTLFPPDQTKNLYIGPLEKTLAGPPISMVRFHEADPQKYPKFERAKKAARVATLEPGDAIYIPYFWWHHVESLCSFNMLVNYWWSDMRPDLGSPYDAMLHAIATFRMMPARERSAWQAMFNHLVFESDGPPGEHIPEHMRGVLGAHTSEQRRGMKQNVIRALAAETGLLSRPR